MVSPSRESPAFPSPAWYPVSAQPSLSPKLRRQREQFYISVYLCPSRRPPGADASNNKWLLPSERGRQMPNREPDPLHAALQHGWEATWGRPVLQVRRAAQMG